MMIKYRMYFYTVFSFLQTLTGDAMKHLKTTLFSMLLAVSLLAGAPTAASAQDEAQLPSLPETQYDQWDELLYELLEQYDAPADKVYAGYLNLITGEEHYLQPDELVTAASMYKVPLNMLIAERMASGELVWGEVSADVPYQEVLEQTILYSSNDWAMFMWERIGGYQAFKAGIAPYIGVDLEDVDEYVYYNENQYSPHQMISCLKTLYDGGEERFPQVMETMKQAEPERFFRLGETRFEIAQKYGYVSEYSSYMNCCGICFTDEPIAIVMFTRSVPYPEELLGAYCTAMCDYAQDKAAQTAQHAEEELRAELDARQTEAPVSPMQTEVPRAVEAKIESKSEDRYMATIICCAAVLAAALFTVIMIAVKRKIYGIKIFWMLICVVLCAAVMILCAIGVRAGTVYAKPEGDPAQTVEEFFDAICARDYELAYSYLRDYTSLGLENAPQSDAGRIVYDALESSYRFTLIGECTQDKLDACQKLSFSYLDLGKTHDDIGRVTMERLEASVASLRRDEIYDENDHYKPELANKAYLQAVETVMADAGSYYSTVELEIKLAYEDGRWQIIAEPALLKALNGGTAY